MSLLQTLLPGIRDFRVPLAVGGIWVAIAAFLAEPHRESLAEIPAVASVAAIAGGFSEGFRVGLLIFVAYVVGIVFDGIQRRAWAAVSGVRSHLPRRFTPNWIALRFESSSRDTLLGNAFHQQTGFSALVCSVIPSAVVFDELELAAMRFSKDAPEQFQRYDRERSEADFRGGIALPLLVAGIVAGLSIESVSGFVVGVVLAAFAWGLAEQAARRSQQADELLAGAIYWGYALTPLLESMGKAAREFEAEHQPNDVDRVIWLVRFFDARGLHQYVSLVVSNAHHPSRGRLAAAMRERATESSVFPEDFLDELKRRLATP